MSSLRLIRSEGRALSWHSCKSVNYNDQKKVARRHDCICMMLCPAGESLCEACCLHLSKLLEQSEGQMVEQIQQLSRIFRDTLQQGFTELLMRRLPQQPRLVL